MAEASGKKRKRYLSPASKDSNNNTKRSNVNGEPSSPAQFLKTKGPPRVTRCFEHQHEAISLTQLSELLQYATLGKGQVSQPSWCCLHHQRKLSGVTVTVLEDVTQVHFYRYYPQFRNLRRRYRTRCTLLHCAGDVPTSILKSKLSFCPPVTSEFPSVPTRCKSDDLQWHPVIRKYGLETRGLSAYVLTTQQMAKHKFPHLAAPDSQSFVYTRKDGHVTDNSPLFGLDCEMCLTRLGLEVTRVSMVDSTGRCVMDELVKPHNPIYNYLTKFSGITKGMMEPVTTRLADVQSKLIELLPQDAVLVGHSLDCDLRALEMIHPNVIDTSIVFPRTHGGKFKLKLLAEVILKKEIQSEERKGHDPTEDALAALELAQYIISKGPRQVAELHQELWVPPDSLPESPVNGSLHKSSPVSVPPVACLNSLTQSSCPPSTGLAFGHALFKTGQPALQLGRLAGSQCQISNEVWRRQKCSSDKKVLEALKRQVQSHTLTLLELSSYSELLTQAQPSYTQRNLHKLVSGLREMCVVYVGPLPPDCTEKDVNRFCRSCGVTRSVRMISSTHQVHAVVEYELLEGAALAVERLSGCELQGCAVKVQRPVNEFTLDMEEYLSDLLEDHSNEHLIYAASVTENDAMTFGQFGPVEGVSIRQPRKKRRRMQAFIKYHSMESVEAALDPSAELTLGQVKVCRALTPPHLYTWVPDTPDTPPESNGLNGTTEGRREDRQTEADDEIDEELDMQVDRETVQIMRKLDSKVGRIFEALPENMLSVVILPGKSIHGRVLPGLCFIEVKQRSSGSPST